MNSIVAYLPKDDKEHRRVISAFANGADIQTREVEDYNRATAPDIAVIYGVYKKAVPYSAFRGRIFEGQKWLGKKTIVLEKGYLKRDQYYAAGWCGLNGRADFANDDVSSDRWEELGLSLDEIKMPENGFKNVLLVGQVPWDASVQHENHIEWLRFMVLKIQSFLPDATIKLRPHPLAIDYTPMILGTEFDLSPEDGALDWADCVITFNSNVGVLSMLKGKPTLSSDCGSMVWNVTPHFLELLPIKIPESKRKQWANSIAYSQWTLEEMETGKPLEHLLNGKSS